MSKTPMFRLELNERQLDVLRFLFAVGDTDPDLDHTIDVMTDPEFEFHANSIRQMLIDENYGALSPEA